MASLEINLTLIGGPTVLIECLGLRLLTDPTFDEPGSYEAGGIMLEKRIGPAFSADNLGIVDAVLLSHDEHFDNLDRTVRQFLHRVRNTFTTQSGAKRLGAWATGLSVMGNNTLRRIERTAAIHNGYSGTPWPARDRTDCWGCYRFCTGHKRTWRRGLHNGRYSMV